MLPPGTRTSIITDIVQESRELYIKMTEVLNLHRYFYASLDSLSKGAETHPQVSLRTDYQIHSHTLLTATFD
jgi:hypothetical protein